MKHVRRLSYAVLVVASCTIVFACGGGSSEVAPVVIPLPGGSPVGAWEWVGGSSVSGASGSYGTKGTAAAGNSPGGRDGQMAWNDSSGNLWLFGGLGFDSAGNGGDLSDLWTFNPTTGQWTWVSGASTEGATGVYGTLGTPAATNAPGARESGVSWIDAAGNLWLFGGAGYDSAGTTGALNDLWEFTPGTGQWTWISGAPTVNAAGSYGTLGTAAANTVPGAREVSLSWIDASGNLWLFGGVGYDSTGTLGDLNDLWRFSPTTGQWTWVSGASTVNGHGVFGTLGTAAATNVPGARYAAVSWIDLAGNLWLMGGSGYDSVGTNGYLNDLWEFSPASGEWTWVAGSATANARGTYGTEGTAAAGNVPGAREAPMAWTDAAGNLWLYGGLGFDYAGSNGYLNDLWKFSPATGQWAWLSGAAPVDTAAAYGTLGASAAANAPGGRFAASAWTDASGNLWMFGGQGIDSTKQVGDLNDLWKYTP